MNQSSFTYAYVVELQPGCWLAPWKGDPGRTEVLSSAKLFDSVATARRALTIARHARTLHAPLVRCVRVTVEMLSPAPTQPTEDSNHGK